MSRRGAPNRDTSATMSGTNLERHPIPSHFTPRAGARGIDDLLGGPFDAPTTPERGDVTEANAPQEDGP
jgi:hypothetical protein